GNDGKRCSESYDFLNPMTDDQEFQQRVQRISGLVHEIDSVADPGTRAASRELVQLLLDLHAKGLERALEIIAEKQEAGQGMIDDLGGDPLVGSLLVLYGLHPLDLESRVERAIQEVAPRIRKGGGELELLGIENGRARLRVRRTGHACGSTSGTLKTMVEDAIYASAPDVAGLDIEGLDQQTPSGFVPLTNIALPSHGVVEQP